MIRRIELKFGSSPGSSRLAFDATPITVFVGPNNSGKSKVIREIGEKCRLSGDTSSNVILESLEFDPFSDASATNVIDNMIDAFAVGYNPSSTFVNMRYPNGSSYTIDTSQLKYALCNPNQSSHSRLFTEHYLQYQTLILDGSNRINLVNDQHGGDLQQKPSTSFQKLFRNDTIREDFRSKIKRSLDFYPVIDPTGLGQLRMRLSRTVPPSPDIERGLGDASIAFHNAAQLIVTASDGAKAFTGIISEILAGNPNVLLMDEPEAFLHPALAFNLGSEIAQSLLLNDKRMFVSTHSPHFLMGCIQSGVAVNVVRLTYRGGVATARLLENTEIKRLMRNPLLRSVGVISALFYESVVVTEGDPDRAFYQEINERLLRVDRGISNCIFLNAQNKQTIPFILDPLRKLGIPCAGIYDIDFVKDGGSVATRYMSSSGIPNLHQAGLATTRAAIARALEDANINYKTSGGISVLSIEDRSAADNYFDQLDLYGVFIVRHGELESWLDFLGIKNHGPGWLIPIFEAMGENPEAPNYLNPTSEDVWSFIDKVANWLQNPCRRGIAN